VRLAGNPNQKFPEQIPVYVPVVPGAVFRWKQVRWAGNSVLSEFTLSGLLGAKSGDIANGIQMEEGWDRIREEYGHHGYLEAKLDPVASYDDQAHTVSYVVSVQEGIPYYFGKIVLTGLSLAAERKLYAAWPIASSNLFDKTKFEELLIKLQSHREQVFGELPVHYETVGHFLQTDPDKRTVDVLLDFK
jgi:outer membrane protein assembly factor BamA